MLLELNLYFKFYESYIKNVLCLESKIQENGESFGESSKQTLPDEKRLDTEFFC